MKKQTFLLILISLSVLTMKAGAQQVPAGKDLTGSWMGKLNPGAISMRVIFNLSYTGRDSLVATLDSPDQGVKGIKLVSCQL